MNFLSYLKLDHCAIDNFIDFLSADMERFEAGTTATGATGATATGATGATGTTDKKSECENTTDIDKIKYSY